MTSRLRREVTGAELENCTLESETVISNQINLSSKKDSRQSEMAIGEPSRLNGQRGILGPSGLSGIKASRVLPPNKRRCGPSSPMPLTHRGNTRRPAASLPQPGIVTPVWDVSSNGQNDLTNLFTSLHHRVPPGSFSERHGGMNDRLDLALRQQWPDMLLQISGNCGLERNRTRPQR